MTVSPDLAPDKLRAEASRTADLLTPGQTPLPDAAGRRRSEVEIDAALDAIVWQAPKEPEPSSLRRLLGWPGRWVRRQAIRAIGPGFFEQQQEQLMALRAKINHLTVRQAEHSATILSLLDAWLGEHHSLITGTREQLSVHWKQLEGQGAQTKQLTDNIQVLNREHIERGERLHHLWESAVRMHGLLSDEAPMLARFIDFFERSRGAEEEVQKHQRMYLEHFRGKRRVIDLGCGRGEFLALLHEEGIGCEGVDIDVTLCARAREKDLIIHHADLLEWLEEQPDASCDGVFCAQVVEHLPIPTVDRVVGEISRVLEPDGRCVIETLNPSNLNIFMGPFWADPGHRRPIHPWTLSVICQSREFMENKVVYSALPPEEFRLQPVSLDGVVEDMRPAIEQLNAQMAKVNDSLYGPGQYAIISRRGRSEELVPPRQ